MQLYHGCLRILPGSIPNRFSDIVASFLTMRTCSPDGFQNSKVSTRESRSRFGTTFTKRFFVRKAHDCARHVTFQTMRCVYAATERGLLVNQHHAIPPGVNGPWTFLIPSTHPEILERACANAVATYKPYEEILVMCLRALSESALCVARSQRAR